MSRKNIEYWSDTEEEIALGIEESVIETQDFREVRTYNLPRTRYKTKTRIKTKREK